MLASDLVAGKAVVHVVSKVLVPPSVAHELGLPVSPGYSPALAPPPAKTSAAGAAAPAQAAPMFGSAAAAAAVLAALLV
jgi:hypothetical protein